MEELFEYLKDLMNENKKNGLKKLYNEYDFDTYGLDKDIIDYCNEKKKFIDYTYNRIKLEEYSNDDFEIILICWDKYSETKIHDHSKNGCVVYVLEGILEEYIYKNKYDSAKYLYSKQKSYIDDDIGLHKMKCKEKGMSIHIYSPPNHIVKNYNL